ncbi:MAG TPA: glycosyltransferase family 4 protein [Caldilineae bacterium]|nr:glycosyltransferase family 4 protein [Caldilineae bacterium]
MSPDLRVLMLSSEYMLQRVGGLGVHVSGLAPRLANHIQLDLVVPRYDSHGAPTEQLGDYGYVHRVDAAKPNPGADFDLQVWRMNDRLNSFVTRRIEEGAQYDVVHAHDWLTGYIANDLHRRYSIPLVATLHATESGRMGGRVRASHLSERIHIAEQHLAWEADQIIACSEFMRVEIESALRASRDKIVVIPNGVEIDESIIFRQHQQALGEFRRRWQPEEGPLIFFVGRLVWEKGPDLLVRAMADVLKVFPSARAVIAGHGPYRDHLLRQIDAMQLQERVQLAGFVSDQERNDLYAVADLAVFPSRYEPFGIVALEAMATGIPVVISAVGGLQDVVVDGVTGLCVAPGNVEALAQAIIKTLAEPQKAAERSQIAQKTVKDEYNWDHIAFRTVDVYKQLVRA